MSLNQRQPRPLARDPETLRDTRLFIVACDDTYAPKQYFDFFRLARVQVHVFGTPDGRCAASDVLERLLEFRAGAEEDDELWMLLDTDHYTQGAHLASFAAALGEANRQGVNVALSKPSFELWLLLHHVEETDLGALATAREVGAALRDKLGQYNKTKLRQGDYPLASVYNACIRAERPDATVAGGDIPLANTTRVYRLWKAIAVKAHPRQLPGELQGLLP